MLQGTQGAGLVAVVAGNRAVMRGAHVPWLTPASLKPHRHIYYHLTAEDWFITGVQEAIHDRRWFPQQLRLFSLALSNIPKIILPSNVCAHMKTTGLVKAGWEILAWPTSGQGGAVAMQSHPFMEWTLQETSANFSSSPQWPFSNNYLGMSVEFMLYCALHDKF